MTGLPSEEVAQDFKDCLNDLQMNNRYEISNLTIIAKENIEHAQALSRTLEHHIRTTAPNRKLPSLYVLDSIVKNVGSPYTIYLGRNLFSIFMDAYTLVDSNTRKSMESMLRTWKEPVPGSMEPTPVFAPETTRVIENALNKARAVMGGARQAMAPRPGSSTFRNTPTPPQQASRYAPPPQNGLAHQPTTQSYQQQSTPQPSAQLAQSLLAALQRPQTAAQDPSQKLQVDIDNLINSTKAEFASNPFDTSIQQRLKALLDLQFIVKTQQLPPDALAAISTQVAALSVTARPSSAQPVQPWQPPASATPAMHVFPPPPNQQHSAPGLPPPNEATFAPGALEALLASTTNGHKPSTPQLRQAMPTIAAPQSGFAASPNGTGNSLVDALKAAGLANSSQSTPAPPLPLPQQPPPPLNAQSTASLLASLSNTLPSLSGLNIPLPNQPPPALPKPRIPLSQSALKTFRPDLLAHLYTLQPTQCPACALRFPSTDKGRSAKAAHLDWHFRTNQRVADSSATHRGLHRMWYLDELAWVKLREVDVSVLTEADAAVDAGGAVADGSQAQKQAQKQRKFVLAPGGGREGVNKSCPICQEPFQSEWSETVQEWVWMDAVEVGGRVYHVNCLAEVSRAGGGGGSGATDGAASGGIKRKAEHADHDGRNKVRNVS